MVFLHKIHMTCLDLGWVQETVDLFSTLDRVICTFEKLKTGAALEPTGEEQDQGLSLGVTKFRALKVNWQADMASRANINQVIEQGETLGQNHNVFAALPTDSFGFHMLPDLLDSVEE